jgi:2-polyprenyl-6-methoxyphenol hydroxylase-like FAD-dependent oxidoreductase
VQAIVIGGSTAGLIAAGVLARSGLGVVLIDKAFGAKPQWEHVHLLSSQSWQDLCDSIPGFEEEIVFQGAACGSQVLLRPEGLLAEDTRTRPSRACIDLALLRTLPKGVKKISGRVTSLNLDQTGVQVTLHDKSEYSGSFVIDASGRSRMSLNAISQLQGEPVDLHQGPASGGYASTMIEGVSLTQNQIALRGKYQNTGILLLKEEENRWRLTLQTDDIPTEDLATESFQKILSDQTSPELSAVFSGASTVGDPFLFGVVRVERVEWNIEKLEGMPWIILGDALLTTPPWLGWGIEQLVTHSRLLREGLQSDASIDDIRNAIDRSARDTWLQATMKETLRGFSTA